MDYCGQDVLPPMASRRDSHSTTRIGPQRFKANQVPVDMEKTERELEGSFA